MSEEREQISDAKLDEVRRRTDRSLPSSATVQNWVVDALVARLDTAESQRDTLRTALIEAQSELERHGHGDVHYGRMPRDPKVLAALARIREALEGTA